MSELDDHKEDRQQIDEPQRAERLPERFKVKPAEAEQAMLSQQAGRLERELQGHPQDVEIGEMHDLAVEISAPVAVDDPSQEQSGNQEEIRHTERLGELHHRSEPALLTHRVLNAKRGMHHHHQDDAKAFGVIDPVDAVPARDIRAHRRPIPVFECVIYA